MLSRLSPLLALVLFACDAGEPIMCTDIAMVSVTVNVTDADGAPVPDAQVSYVPADGVEADCEPLSDTAWLCGYEVAGEIDILVSADGFTDALETVTVGADECHVISETLDIVLVPLV